MILELDFAVDGYPPTKNQARSLFSAEHGQAVQVRTLLEAARQAIDGTAFQPFIGAIALEVIVWAPGTKPPADATNYLGGIADVLQRKDERRLGGISLAHLGDLGLVAVYDDDKQIREIHYRQEDGDIGYHVCVRTL